MKFTLSSLAVLGVALTQATAQVPVGGQCGGRGWDGFSQLCADGSYCAMVSDDFQCLSADNIRTKSVSFILTTFPTFTLKPAPPLSTIVPTIYPPCTTATPCPTVTTTVSVKVPVTYTVVQPTTFTTTATVTSVVTNTAQVTYTQSCSSTSTTKASSTTTTTTRTSSTTVSTVVPTSNSTLITSTTKPPTSSTISTTTTTRTTTSTDKPCPTNYPPDWAGKNFTYKGINIAGFEFGCLNDGSCTYPNAPPQNYNGIWEMQWFFKWNMNTFRFPIGWQYVTPTLGGPFDTTEWGLYNDLIKNCTVLPNVYCIVDIHNYARWNGQVIGQSSGVTDNHFVKLWQMIASYYANEPRIIFGLMNEPYKLDIGTWAKTLQKVVTAIRAIAPKHIILLPGIEYSHADTFISSGSAAALDAISNPDGSKTNLIFDIHQWLDKTNSGTDPYCVTNNVAVFEPLAQWLRCHGRQAFLSATGGGNGKLYGCNPLLCEQMEFLLANSDVFVGYNGWAAGSYDSTYILDESPSWSNPLVDTELVSACMYWP